MTREDETIKNDKNQIYELSSDPDEDKKCCLVTIDCENEAANKTLHIGKPSTPEVVIVSSSDSGSNDSDVNKNACTR